MLDLVLYFVLFWIGLHVYYHSRIRGVCRSMAQMNGKTVLVTGCDSGIGKVTALELAKRRARVIMTCVGNEANSVREYIVNESKNSNVVVKKLDLSSMKSVRQFAEDINQTESRLDVLIHNAGVLAPPTPVTEDGLNTTLAVNTYGPFLLTLLLSELLKTSGNSRIVVVASNTYQLGHIDINEPNPIYKSTMSKGRFNWRMYCMSKLGIVLIVKELDRRLKGSGVTVNFLHPGIVVTSILVTYPWLLKKFICTCVPFFKSEEQGAQTTIHLAVSEDVEGVSGKYFVDCKEASSCVKIDDIDLCRQFWAKCEEIVKLNTSDPHL